MRLGIVIVIAILSATVAHSETASEDRFPFLEAKDPATRAAAIKTLNEYLRDFGRGVRIRDCSILLWSHRGKVEDMYAGICKLQTGHEVALCGDTGIGVFGLDEQVNSTMEAVSEFARTNCRG